MIRSYSIQTDQRNSRLSQKTLDHTFLHMIQNGANCPPFVSHAILDTAKKVYRINEADGRYAMKEGQMKIIGVTAHEPAGKRLSECQLKECIVTIYNDSEDDYNRAAYGTTGLRRGKLLRIATEAWEQGVLLTHEDFAFKILHCGLRTIARDIKYFKERHIFVPTRGQQMDIGPGTSHKILAVEMMLQRKNEHEIARLIYHSLKAIERYTVSFARVVMLKQKGFTVNDIAFVVQISSRLVEEYLHLFDTYKANPDYKERLDEITGKAQSFIRLVTEAPSPDNPNKKKNGEGS